MENPKKKLEPFDLSRRTALEPLSDFELVQRVVQTSDATAFELIMRRHNQRLYRLARSVLKNQADAEDVVQETYLTAFDKLHSFRGPDGFASWLSRIALNFSYRRVNRRGKVVFFEDFATSDDGQQSRPNFSLDQLESDDVNPELQMQLNDLRAILEKAIDELPQEFRTVFILGKVEGQSIKEISETLSLNEQTVKTRLHRARQKLKASVDKAFDELMPSVHSFDGERCDRIVERVLAKLTR